MRNFFPVLAVSIAALCLVLTIALRDSTKAARAIRAERNALMAEVINANQDADQQHAQNALLRLELEGRGIPVPSN